MYLTVSHPRQPLLWHDSEHASVEHLGHKYSHQLQHGSSEPTPFRSNIKLTVKSNEICQIQKTFNFMHSKDKTFTTPHTFIRNVWSKSFLLFYLSHAKIMTLRNTYLGSGEEGILSLHVCAGVYSTLKENHKDAEKFQHFLYTKNQSGHQNLLTEIYC